MFLQADMSCRVEASIWWWSNSFLGGLFSFFPSFFLTKTWRYETGWGGRSEPATSLSINTASVAPASTSVQELEEPAVVETPVFDPSV